MKTFRANITKREVYHTHRDGRESCQDRYVLNYRDPATRKRRQQFFETRKEAEAARHELFTMFDQGLFSAVKRDLTVEETVQHWLKSCEGRVVKRTYLNYKQLADTYIIGPVLEGTRSERITYTWTGKLPEGTRLVPMLGKVKMSELTTAGIRSWLQTIMRISTPYTARSVKKHLATILALAEEDFGIRAPRMPKRSDIKYRKKERLLLRQDQVKLILDEARKDRRCGIYYAWPFLTGTRPSEMLGVIWSDIDLERDVISIRRMQDDDGNIKPFPKTAAGERIIPIVPLLKEMLLEWKPRCPRRPGHPDRVFPSLGFETSDPDRVVMGGGAFLQSNFRNRLWRPMLKRLGLPPITPYAARHLLISNLQAEGVEIGVVSKIAGHKNPQVTLRFYTHAVRDIAPSMDKINGAYGLSS